MSVVPASFRARVRSSIETPVARLFGRLGFSPNALTLIGFGIAVVGAVLAAQQSWLIAGLVVGFGAAFDLFDGALARATGTSSKFGAFMDSVFDRAGEAVVYVGIVFGTLVSDYFFGAIAASAALAAAFMVSYTRAKAESLGFSSGSGMASVGLAPREVRSVILVIGLILAGSGPLVHIPPAGSICIDDCTLPNAFPLLASLALIALLATITTIQRIYFVYQQSKSINQEDI
ncbi:MAG: CDP-alcohol phosphatidyltransferase family protein [Chloroflexota bacterium]